jgi:hypothetical protein
MSPIQLALIPPQTYTGSLASKDSSVSVFPESRAMAKHARSSLKRAFKKSKRRKGGKKTLARTVNRILNTKLKVKHASV